MLIEKAKTYCVENKLFIFVILLASFVRLIGLNWGYPFIFHPDEPTLIRGGTGIRFDPNPHHFDWPHLQTYLMFFVIALWARFTDILEAVGLRGSLEQIVPLWWDRPFVFYFLGRLISALAGIGAVILTYIISFDLFKKKSVAVLSSMLLVFSFQSIEDSHFATLDSSLTFWVLLSFLFSLKIVRTGNVKYYLLSGFLAGLATSTKYNGAFVTFSIFASHISYIVINNRKRIEILYSNKLLYSALALIGGFLLGTPYALLDYKTFFSTEPAIGALWQLSRQSTAFMERYLNFSLMEKNIRSNLFMSLSPFVLLFFFYGSLSLFTKNFKLKYLPLLIFGIGYLYYVSMFPVFYAQYFNPLYPFIAIISAWGVCQFTTDFNLKKVVFYLLLIFMFTPMILRVSDMMRVYLTDDNRIRAYSWIKQNVRAGETVALAGSEKLEVEDISEDGLSGYVATSLMKEINDIGKHKTESAIIQELVNRKVFYVVASDFDLQEQIENPYEPGFEYWSSGEWVVNNLWEVVRFVRRSPIEPTISIRSTVHVDQDPIVIK